MRRIMQWVAYPPNAFISLAVVHLMISVCCGVFFTPMDRLLRTIEIIQQETVTHGGEVQSPIRIDQWILYGRPWIGLLAGVVAGSLFYSSQIRFRKRRFDELLPEMSAKILTRNRAKPIPRRDLVVLVLPLPLILLSLSALFQLSVIMVGAGMQTAMITLYPLLRRQFDTIVANVTRPSLDPETAELGIKWIRSQRRGATFVTAVAVVSSIGMLVFTVSNLDTLEGINEDVRYIEELSAQLVSEDKATPHGDAP